jgi:TonB family protein
MFELVLMAIIGVCVYALVERHVRKREPVRDQATRVSVRDEPPAAPEAEPEPEPVVAEPPVAVEESAPPAMPDALDAQMVRDGVALVQDAIARCGERFPDAAGLVKLSVKVAPDGSVSSVKVAETDSKRLGSCAAAAMRGASFAPTAQGGNFSYPFRFGEQ